MASEHGPVSAAPIATAALSPTLTSTTTLSLPDPDTGRLRSLKRSRPDQSQNPANLTSIASAGLGASPSPKSPRLKGAFSGFSPSPLTGAAALADEQREKEEMATGQLAAMSENPGHKALSSLMASGGAPMSRSQDAPSATTATSDGMSAASNAISNPNTTQSDDKPDMSPESVTSHASLGGPAQTATASPTIVASPTAMTAADADIRDSRSGVSSQLQAPIEDYPSHRGALSYPGNVLAPSDPTRDPARFPARGLSLPVPGQNQALAPRSPTQKKYKCQYCETEFTRHHNLKSHLLTHSQEKPYVCQTCSMRFRRLHDLKRHMKLHTGERPHICPKCDRKFARGDALARHAKGQGGCAGRRASMGSFAGDDDYEGSQAGEGDDSGMDGVMYTNGTPHLNDAEMTEEDRRRYSLPAIKAQHLAGSQDNYNPRSPSTYPPAGPRSVQQVQSTGGLYPPNTDRGGGSPGPGTSPNVQNSNIGGGLSSMGLSNGGNSMYPQSGGITESPKPLSPAGMISHQLGQDPSINRQRSPTLNTQFQQQHFSRRQSDRASPTGMSLPSPHSQGPKLPAIAGLAPPEQSAPVGPPHQQGGGSADGSNNLFAAGERGVWAYVQTLEDKVKQLSDKVQAMEAEKVNHREQVASQQDQINRLSDEVFSLRGQLSTQNQSQQASASGHS
ncbi:hypothetical protein M430DRAFT_102809 [Amorphotheca resinae ATCC 22711]|uniref:C2H2-type domain-containing protein n=1 Tax=Amorphotheca resinae ATCC 22711 TaxID=857342 RepID=A0A2T3B0P4_AMORE|nr:hypothetical protein M430DRAFT_102809 [Amorphotheca resinae ATCC 22711]PSS16979.1 hypothetical protein M430DRAFT_102809 [Amorphotheca resinae ATCC 22711]